MLARCMERLQEELSGFFAEILVIDASKNGVSGGIPNSADIRIVRMVAGSDVPKLWQAGIDASRGTVISLLVESCIVGPGWAERVLRSHRAPWPVVGGAIDLDARVGLVNSAIYFCRYSRYLPPFEPVFRDDLPGINCSYKRVSLVGLEHEMRDGFWETFVHQRMRNRGERLLSDASILVNYVGSTELWVFLRERFIHGRQFARRRGRGLHRTEKILRALAFPIVPWIMVSRTAAQIFKRRRCRARLLASLPLVIAFFSSWSLGECIGYLLRPSDQEFLGEKQAGCDEIS